MYVSQTTRAQTGEWTDSSAWVGDGLRREVFFFPSNGEQLYGSLYAPLRLRRPFGLVICSSWGVDADRLQRFTPALAIRMAQLGGVALTFHFPGYGDSSGAGEAVTIDTLAAAAVAAIFEGAGRYPDVTWMMAGFLLGASVAAVAAGEAGVRALLLVQPALDPAAYVETVVRRARKRRLAAGDTEDSAFGYPIPKALLHPAPAAAVAASLAAFDGRGLVVHYPESQLAPASPEGFEVSPVPGSWRVAQRDYPGILEPAVEWLDEVTSA